MRSPLPASRRPLNGATSEPRLFSPGEVAAQASFLNQPSRGDQLAGNSRRSPFAPPAPPLPDVEPAAGPHGDPAALFATVCFALGLLTGALLTLAILKGIG